jgi:hypothetical protein
MCDAKCCKAKAEPVPMVFRVERIDLHEVRTDYQTHGGATQVMTATLTSQENDDYAKCSLTVRSRVPNMPSMRLGSSWLVTMELAQQTVGPDAPVFPPAP